MAFENERTEGNIHQPKNDPGKGTATLPPNDGDLIGSYGDQPEQKGAFLFRNSNVRGEDVGDLKMGTSFPSSGVPQWTEGLSTDENAINRLGGFNGEADSDPMFDRFKHEENSMSDIDANVGSGHESPENVSSGGFPGDDSGTKSDPKFQRLPEEQTKGSGQDYTGR